MFLPCTVWYVVVTRNLLLAKDRCLLQGFGPKHHVLARLKFPEKFRFFLQIFGTLLEEGYIGGFRGLHPDIGPFGTQIGRRRRPFLS